jgi:hypothetical protein
MKYRYEIKRAKEVATKFSSLQMMEEFVTAEMNKIGEEGGVLLGPPVEFQESTSLTDNQGRPIPYYGVVMFVRYEIPEEEGRQLAV